MSRMFCTDEGRVLRTHNEEITRWRWARKRLTLPAAAAAGERADLWMLLAMYTDNRRPLVVSVNGQTAGRITRNPEGTPWAWVRLPVRPGLLRRGSNEIILSTDTPAMNGWVLAIDGTVPNRGSALSLDRGKTWRTDRLGAHAALRGEYVIRLRSHARGLSELTPPRIVYEDPRRPRVRELRQVVPSAIRAKRDPWEQVLALRAWVASRWVHHPWGTAYAPWDPWTLLDWAKRQSGHHTHHDKIAYCVHFNAMFAALVQALGHRGRCVAITRQVNSFDGHFVAEVFDRRLGRWVLHDANYDMHYEDGQPLSAVDIADRAIAGASCMKLVRKGPSFPVRGPQRLLKPFRDIYGSGRAYRSVAIWVRNDYTSDPTVVPPNHGCLCYSETGFVRYAPRQLEDSATAMFPWRVADRAWFEQAPPLQ